MSQAAADTLAEEANELLRAEKFSEAAEKFERATQLFPPHPLAWKGLGHSLLCLGRTHEAARAFDRAIGLRPESATALWGGAVAHAELGNRVVAQNYLRRTLALQPSWIEMARSVAHLAPFLQVSTRAADALRAAIGTYSTRTYYRASDASYADASLADASHADASRSIASHSIEVGRFVNQPRVGYWTYATIGLSNTKWAEIGRPRIELLLASTVDAEVCSQIVANLAFHLADTGFFPEPGVLVRDVIAALGAGDLSERLPHVYITVPRPWRLSLPLDLGPPPITVAQVVPVSEAEYALWREDVGGFEAKLAKRKVDLLNLKRPG